ncbi:MAG: outer membrane protein assembly factor BamD [Rikenellaceae bacterium]
MKFKILAIFLLAALASGCSAHYKLLKSNDSMAKYEAAMANYKAKKYEKAKSLFDSALPTLVGTPYEDTIIFTLGKAFYESKDFETAGEMMDQYRNKFPRSEFTPEAEYIYAMSFYKLSGDVEKDQTSTRRAISAFGEYINRYPESKFAPEIKVLTEELYNKLYLKKYLNGALYFQLEYYLSAITSLRAILKSTPETPYKEDIEYLICKSWFEYARNSIPSRQLDRYLNTIDAYYNFIASFPESKQFGKELARIKDIAQDFVENNGTAAQSVETSSAKIEAAKKAISKSKDDLFEAKTKEERQRLRKVISDSRVIISTERKKAREEEKLMKANKKAKIKELKELEKELKAEEAETERQQKEERKKRIEELRQKESEAATN